MSDTDQFPGHARVARRAVKVAYIMARLPKITETFVLYEILALERLGLAVEVYPLRRERQVTMHPEAARVVERAHFEPWVSGKILAAHGHFLRRNAGRYFRTLGVLLWSTLRSPRFFLAAIAFFPKMVYFAYSMARGGVTHVHAHFASHPAAAAFVIHRLTGIPYSFTAHGSDLHCDRTMLRLKVSEAAFVVAISNYNRELIVHECGEASRRKVVVVHCGVDTAIFRPALEPQGGSGQARRPINIVCVGTLHEVKGQAYLVEACRMLCERGVPFTCHLIGDGPDQRLLARKVRALGSDSPILLHGSRTRPEIVEFYRRADVVVAPSVPTRDGRREGIPVVLMEAMASGVPVVASRISGIPELVEHGAQGLLVPPRDPKALADAVQRVWEDAELRNHFRRAGRRKVEAEFDLVKNASVLSRLFAQVGATN